MYSFDGVYFRVKAKHVYPHGLKIFHSATAHSASVQLYVLDPFIYRKIVSLLKEYIATKLFLLLLLIIVAKHFPQSLLGLPGRQ